MVQKPDVRLAVLIDGENISAKLADGLFEKIAALGWSGVRRVYGTRHNGKLKPWAGAIEQHGILPIHVPTNGKNCTDMAMAIDAMDLLHSGRYDGFCLVSSDRDFSGLAERIRAQSCIAYGFGEGKSSPMLKGAFSKFFVIGSVAASEPAVQVTTSKAAKKPAAKKQPIPIDAPKAANAVTNQGPHRVAAKPAGSTLSVSAAKSTAQLRTVEKQAHLAWPWIEAALPPELGAWMTLSALEKALHSNHPDYLKNTGFSSLEAILAALGSKFEPGTAPDGKTAQVRRRRP